MFIFVIYYFFNPMGYSYVDIMYNKRRLNHEQVKNMALIYLMRPWTSTNAENFETSRVNYISKISKNDPIQHIYVKSVYSTPQY